MLEKADLRGVVKLSRVEGEFISNDCYPRGALHLGFSMEAKFSDAIGLYMNDRISPSSFLGVAAKLNSSVSFFTVVLSGSTIFTLRFLI